MDNRNQRDVTNQARGSGGLRSMAAQTPRRRGIAVAVRLELYKVESYDS